MKLPVNAIVQALIWAFILYLAYLFYQRVLKGSKLWEWLFGSAKQKVVDGRKIPEKPTAFDVILNEISPRKPDAREQTTKWFKTGPASVELWTATPEGTWNVAQPIRHLATWYMDKDGNRVPGWRDDKLKWPPDDIPPKDSYGYWPIVQARLPKGDYFGIKDNTPHLILTDDGQSDQRESWITRWADSLSPF